MPDRDDRAPGPASPAHGPPTDAEPGDDWGDVQIGRWQSGPPPRPTAGHTGVGPKGYRRSDARIREELCDGLTADAAIDPSDVAIEVRDGAVTLEGGVPDPETGTLIAERAWGVAGVREVHNRLRVAGAGEEQR